MCAALSKFHIGDNSLLGQYPSSFDIKNALVVDDKPPKGCDMVIILATSSVEKHLHLVSMKSDELSSHKEYFKDPKKAVAMLMECLDECKHGQHECIRKNVGGKIRYTKEMSSFLSQPSSFPRDRKSCVIFPSECQKQLVCLYINSKGKSVLFDQYTQPLSKEIK